MPGIENLNLPSVSPYSSITSRFSQSFQQFVKEIADAKSKGEEDRVITKEISKLKVALLKPDTAPKRKKEQLVKLIYCEMLGHEVSFAYMEAVKFAQQQDLMHKRVAYVALGIFLDERNETECMMNTGSIQRDLKSTNVINICFGLIAASKLVYKDMMQAVLPSVVSLLKDNREVVRKKAIMAMFHFWKINPDACNFHQYFHEALFDKDPAVMAASLIVYAQLVQKEPSLYKNLTVSFVSILKQILDRRLPEEYNYHTVPSPWMQIQLLKILAYLGSDDVSQSKQMYEVLRQCLEITCTDQIIGCSVLYECMRTVATIYVNRSLMEASATKASIFLMSDDHNLKYLGIKTLTDFVGIDVSYASRHQQVIIDCLNDQDDSLKRKTLDLLYRMTSVSNVKVICDKMIQYLRSTIDEFVRGGLVTRITTLAEKYAPDNEWYIETMNEVFELGGNLVPDDIAHNTMRIIGEGVDDDGGEEEDEENSATVELRRNAVFAYVRLMEKPMLPDILVKLISWVVGEYIDSEDGYDIGEVIDNFYGMLHMRFNDKYTQSWIITAITKILARCPEPQQFFRRVNPEVLNPDAKQRYLELKAIIDLCVDVEEVLPFDASCEDLEIDEGLSFLDDFVRQAAENGAPPYAPHKESAENIPREQGNMCALKFIYPEAKPTPPQAIVDENDDSTSSTTQFTAVQSPPPIASPDMNRLTTKKTWTKEGRRRQSSESEISPSQLSSSSSNSTQPTTTAGIMDVAQKKSVDEDSSSSTTSKSSESVSKMKESAMKLQKDEKLISALFGGGGNTPSLSGGGGSGGGSTTSVSGKGRRQHTKNSKQRTSHRQQTEQPDLLGGLTEIEVSSLSPSQRQTTITTGLVDPLQQSTLQSELVDQSANDLLSHQDHASRLGDPSTNDLLFLQDRASLLEDPSTNNLRSHQDYMPTLLTASTSAHDKEALDLLDGLQLQDQTTLPMDSHSLTNPLDEQQATFDESLPALNQSQSSVNPLDLPLTNALPETTTTTTETEPSNLPKELTGFNCSPLTEVASDICVRVTSQNVYKPDELAMVIFLLNKTSNPLKNITFNMAPPSSLRGNTEELIFNREADLNGTNSFCHVINLRYRSPSPRMLVSGYISYRDYTNTEKKLFLNITHAWNDLLRPSLLTTHVFGERWLNRSLHERKNTVQECRQTTELSITLQTLNIEVIQEIGAELIAACTVLGKEEILTHFNTTKTSVEVKVKSSSERLNEYVLEMICSAL